MITDNDKNYNSDGRDLIQDNQRDTDQNQQPVGNENRFEDQRLSDNENYTDSEFSNALEQNDQNPEQDFQENDLEEDLEDDDDAEYDENDWEEEEEDDDSEESIEPETFTDDSLKID